MNDRKHHVIKSARELYVEKGFQATSIQDILERSGISKGTFYNYFSSKNELIIAVFNELFTNIDQERDRLVMGKDPSDTGIFIKQVELQLIINKKNKMFILFEEVLSSEDTELKEFIENRQLKMLYWTFHRFLDIFGEDKKAYLFDASIMFTGLLFYNIKFYIKAHGTESEVRPVVAYTVRRLEKMVNEAAESGDQLMKPEFLFHWLPDFKKEENTHLEKLKAVISEVRTILKEDIHFKKYTELLDFLEEEMQRTPAPRKILVESVLQTLQNKLPPTLNKKITQLQQLTEA